jgi:hypothetical protein
VSRTGIELNELYEWITAAQEVIVLTKITMTIVSCITPFGDDRAAAPFLAQAPFKSDGPLCWQSNRLRIETRHVIAQCLMISQNENWFGISFTKPLSFERFYSVITPKRVDHQIC